MTDDAPDTRIEMEITVRYLGFDKEGQTHSLVYESEWEPGDTKKSIVQELFAQGTNAHLDLAEDKGLLT